MKWLVILGISLSLFFATTLVYAQEQLVYVDIGQVLEEYKKTKEYDKVLEKQQKKYDKEREGKVNQVKELQEKLSVLSDEEKEARRSELEEKITQLQQFDRDILQDLRKQRDEKVKDVFKDIKDVIDAYAKKQGYSLVFDKRALIYYDDKLDITDKILKVLNK